MLYVRPHAALCTSLARPRKGEAKAIAKQSLDGSRAKQCVQWYATFNLLSSLNVLLVVFKIPLKAEFMHKKGI